MIHFSTFRVHFGPESSEPCSEKADSHMATNNQKKPSVFQGHVNNLLDGFTATPGPDFTSLMVQGQQQATTAIIADLQAIDIRNTAVATAKAAYNLALTDRKDSSAADGEYVASLEAALKVQLYGNQGALNTFGIGPAKQRTSPSPKKKVAAAATAAATRVARGTKGKKQSLAITAVPEPLVSVTGVVGAPAAGTAPAASASPAPAPNPAPAGTAGH